MSNSLLASGIRRSLRQVRYVTPVLPGAADGLVGQVYAQAERDFGLVAPPLALHSPAPTALAAAWLMLRETLLATGAAGRAEKETVAAAVSADNACPYCVAVHTATIGTLGAEDVPTAIALWAGSTGRPAASRPSPASGFAELAGVAVTFHYLNRMVTLFLPESPLPPLTPKPMTGWVMGMLASAMLAAQPAPGVSLALLPPAPLPAEFAWASGTPHVAEALARAAAAVDEAGRKDVPEPVRELVLDRLRAWDGRPPDVSRAWTDQPVAGLASADRAAGRLALLTAFAPYQVVAADIAEVNSHDDGALIALTSWASMAAARTVASWITAPSRNPDV